jgi:hypothetical protein
MITVHFTKIHRMQVSTRQVETRLSPLKYGAEKNVCCMTQLIASPDIPHKDLKRKISYDTSIQ